MKPRTRRPPRPAPPGITLRELRTYTARTQQEAAAQAAMTQGELSKLERRHDFLLSTVRRYVEALGGSVDVMITLGSSSFRLLDGQSPTQEPTMDDLTTAIDGLAALDTWLRPLIGAVPAAALTERRPGCGTFSLAEHVWHLRDLDVEAWSERVRRILGEDAPALADFDGERAAVERDYQAQAIAPAVTELLATRRRAIGQLRKLDAAAFAREGVLDGVGRISLATLVARWRAHDLGHRIEMERLAAEVASAGKP